MKRTTLAIYERKSTLPHYCRSAWAYAGHTVRIECSFDDYSQERKEQAGDEDYQMITYRCNPKTKEKVEVPVEELFADLYTVTTTNVRGVKTNHSFRTKDEANAAFIRLKSEFKGWVKI